MIGLTEDVVDYLEGDGETPNEAGNRLLAIAADLRRIRMEATGLPEDPCDWKPVGNPWDPIPPWAHVTSANELMGKIGSKESGLGDTGEDFLRAHVKDAQVRQIVDLIWDVSRAAAVEELAGRLAHHHSDGHLKAIQRVADQEDEIRRLQNMVEAQKEDGARLAASEQEGLVELARMRQRFQGAVDERHTAYRIVDMLVTDGRARPGYRVREWLKRRVDRSLEKADPMRRINELQPTPDRRAYTQVSHSDGVAPQP